MYQILTMGGVYLFKMWAPFIRENTKETSSRIISAVAFHYSSKRFNSRKFKIGHTMVIAGQKPLLLYILIKSYSCSVSTKCKSIFSIIKYVHTLKSWDLSSLNPARKS